MGPIIRQQRKVLKYNRKVLFKYQWSEPYPWLTLLFYITFKMSIYDVSKYKIKKCIGWSKHDYITIVICIRVKV